MKVSKAQSSCSEPIFISSCTISSSFVFSFTFFPLPCIYYLKRFLSLPSFIYSKPLWSVSPHSRKHNTLQLFGDISQYDIAYVLHISQQAAVKSWNAEPYLRRTVEDDRTFTCTPKIPNTMKKAQQMRTMFPMGLRDVMRVSTTSFRPGARLITLQHMNTNDNDS